MILPKESATFSSCRFNFFRLSLIPNSRDFKDLKDSKAPKDGATEFPDGGGATGCAIDR